MGDKKKLAAIEDKRLSYMAGLLLKDIAAGLSKREFSFETAEGMVSIAVPKEVEVEFSVEQKTKDEQSKTKLKLEIEWTC